MQHLVLNVCFVQLLNKNMDLGLDLSVEERVEIFFRYAKSRDAEKVTSDFNEKYNKKITQDVVMTLFHRFLRTGSVLEEAPGKRKRKKASTGNNAETPVIIKKFDENEEIPPVCSQTSSLIKSEPTQETFISEIKEEQPQIYYPKPPETPYANGGHPSEEPFLKVRSQELLTARVPAIQNMIQQPSFIKNEPVSFSEAVPQPSMFPNSTTIKTEPVELPANEPIYVEPPVFMDIPPTIVKIEEQPGMRIPPPINSTNMQHPGYINNYAQQFHMNQHANFTNPYPRPMQNVQAPPYHMGNPNSYGAMHGNMPIAWNQPPQMWNQAPQYNYNHCVPNQRMPMFHNRNS